MQIGSADKSDQYIFSAIDGLDVDDNGHIYVLDGRAAEVRVFSQDGEYLRSIGGRGQGPGEMQRPRFLQITADNELVVQDYVTQHFLYFSLDGRFLRQRANWKTDDPAQPVKIDQQGNLIGLEIFAPPPIGGKVLRKYNSNFKPIMTLAEQPPDMAAKTEYNVLRPTFYFDIFEEGKHLAKMPIAINLDRDSVWKNGKLYTVETRQDGVLMVKRFRVSFNPPY